MRVAKCNTASQKRGAVFVFPKTSLSLHSATKHKPQATVVTRILRSAFDSPVVGWILGGFFIFMREVSHGIELKIDSFESNGAAEWETILTVDSNPFVDSDLIQVKIECLYRRTEKDAKNYSEDRKTTEEACISLTPKQATHLANFLLQSLRQ